MASKVAAPKFTELIYGEACHIAHRVELGAHLTGSHSACENLGRTSAQARLLITLASTELRTSVADLLLVPNLNSEILNAPSRFQLRDQPARPLATTGPSL
jgi:hypothetical protein